MKPVKLGWKKRLVVGYRHIIAWCKVWLGLAVWAKVPNDGGWHMKFHRSRAI